ncbi:hypothetical protein [Sinorhizobium sp. RAC02]|uniref:hypothetical protein n=1 Tax=Sinorhizobium sp. RAC02 TaxID=1842534 RepID=UPI00083DF6FE|nr:hypothetical protein [Sinorhizobium sp. RAC02]AOF90694.1 hypothetical protein BSY16_981 [Sinorhizobium sp. RAC02]
MHTAAHTVDRRLAPRRLVPRRSSAHPHANDPHKIATFLEEVFHASDEPIYQVGDLITFRKADRTVGSIMILEINGRDVTAMFYDGLPHRFDCSFEDIASLRIVRIEDSNTETVAMYRELVGVPKEVTYTN